MRALERRALWIVHLEFTMDIFRASSRSSTTMQLCDQMLEHENMRVVNSSLFEDAL